MSRLIRAELPGSMAGRWRSDNRAAAHDGLPPPFEACVAVPGPDEGPDFDAFREFLRKLEPHRGGNAGAGP